ncbi:MAG: hypothetical protein WBQ14_05345 [Gaiellaceae bacterium]
MLWAARVLARAFGAVWELLSGLRRRPGTSDPAEELRSRLAEARARDAESVPAPAEPEPIEPEVPAEPAPAPGQDEGQPDSADLEKLRRDVHERGRALSEQMRGTSKQDR